MADQLTSLEIDRGSWKNGSTLTEICSSLLEPAGRGFSNPYDMDCKCCLGFLCLAAGHTRQEIMSLTSPEGMESFNEFDTKHLVEDDEHENTIWTEEAININDQYSFTLWNRERKLIEHFKKIGVSLTFKGEYHPLDLNRDREKCFEMSHVWIGGASCGPKKSPYSYLKTFTKAATMALKTPNARCDG